MAIRAVSSSCARTRQSTKSSQEMIPLSGLGISSQFITPISGNVLCVSVMPFMSRIALTGISADIFSVPEQPFVSGLNIPYKALTVTVPFSTALSAITRRSVIFGTVSHCRIKAIPAAPVSISSRTIICLSAQSVSPQQVVEVISRVRTCNPAGISGSEYSTLAAALIRQLTAPRTSILRGLTARQLQ